MGSSPSVASLARNKPSVRFRPKADIKELVGLVRPLHQPAPSDTELLMDITDLILNDHAEQRRLFALIEQIPPENDGALGAVWGQLRALLDAHALAEERFFYPELLKIGRGADSKSPVEETRDAIKDHNEIRDVAAKVEAERPGSSEWFGALAAANHANSDHMGEEERQGLTDFRRSADLALRHQVGVKFLQFRSEHLAGVAPVDQDPDAYVRTNS